MKPIPPYARHRPFRSGKWMTPAAALAAAVAISWISGCGGPSGGKGEDAAPGETIYVEGKISLRGSRPFPLLLLEAKDGAIYMIDTSPKADELKNLDGMAVGVTAKVLPGVKGDAPALSVSAYSLLPLPSGEKPIVGIVYTSLTQGDIRASLTADDGSVWIIEGWFKTAFVNLNGARVWIAGVKQSAVNTQDGDIRVINVTEYGLIRPRQDGVEIPAP
ncbi:MAG: hypothetical protein H6Q78_555 [Candidatus Krumholzibacteriota bacterium]|nr:hypothetical protein [Candidatus Krumholzibacteriota bacterium]